MVTEVYTSHIGFNKGHHTRTVEVESRPKRSNGTIHVQVNSL
jgi:hypothetical protein